LLTNSTYDYNKIYHITQFMCVSYIFAVVHKT